MEFVSGANRLDVANTTAPVDLMCIQYPGIVINEENAIKTLGGMDSISKVFSDVGYNCLELKFRPGDSYCKPAVARQSKPCCLALKIKRRKRQSQQQHSDGSVSEYRVELLGTVNVQYDFTGMADFQLLPPGLNSTLVDHNLYQLTELYQASIFSHNLPEFIPPATVYSKLDRPANYSYKPDSKHNVGANIERPIQQIPGRARLRRPNFTYGITFDHKEAVPMSPKPFTPNINHPKLAALKQLFEDRPVWSRNAIQSKLKISSVVCKQLLPLVSYNFTTGPWRSLWVRFGYDPRASPEGKIYQKLDFRVPKHICVVSPSKNYQQRQRRPLGVGGETASRWKMRFLHQEEEHSMKRAEERLGEITELDDSVHDPMYVFDPAYLPQQRQQFFQLCDLHADVLQTLVHSNDGKESNCSEASGWCEEDTYDKLRKLLVEIITDRAKQEGVDVVGQQSAAGDETADNNGSPT